jgi:spore protease
MDDIRTDLAIEAAELYECDTKESGVDVKEYTENEINITKVVISNDIAERNMGKPKGTYITIDMPKFAHYDGEIMDDISKVVGKCLSELIETKEHKTTLVVGLGNWNVTPDALGPKVVSKMMVTRHLKELAPETIDDDIRAVCALAPGVLGITGIETGEIIKGVVDKIKPDLVVCIDALASRRMYRVNSTIQIGDTGISPGAGVGNKRKELSEKTLGIPVIAIGVPTVVDAATMANDTIDLVIDEMQEAATQGGEFYNLLKSIDREEKMKMIRGLLDPYVGDLVVTPKEVDMVIDSVSKIVANGINIALQPELELEDINKFLN